MAKSTHSGASFSDDELNDPTPPPVVQRAMLGGDPSSDGNSWPQSSGTPESDTVQPAPYLPSHVQTTESPSKESKDVPESSTAHSTDGNTPETDKASSSRKRTPSAKKTATEKATTKEDDSKKARVRSTDEDEDDFGQFV
jgi:hypothetical protein